MKIIFIYPDMARKEKDWTGHYYFGIGLLSSNLKRAGHETKLIHVTHDITKNQLLNRLSEIISSNSIIAISATTHMFPYVTKWSKWIKKRFKAPIICGGIHATLNPDETINQKEIDMVCLGEGEKTLVELCNKMEIKQRITDIEGLWIKKGRRIHKNSLRGLIENLDDLPFADRDLFEYKDMYWEKRGIGNFMASRGCPFDCSYCCNHTIKQIYTGKGKYVRVRSVKNVIKEMKEVIKKYPFIKEVAFDDDIFGMKKDWLKEFSEEYKKRIGLPFTCNFRVTLLDEERIKLLKNAGCVKLRLGLESGNDFILNKILNRNMTRNDIIKAFRLCKKYNIRIHSFNMVGLPHENVDRILDTIKLNALLDPEDIQISIFYPYEGTKLYELCQKEGFLTNKRLPNYHTDTVCIHPNLSSQQIRMFCYYFRQIVGIYSFLYKRKGRLSKNLESVLDYLLHTQTVAYLSLIMYKPLKSIKRILSRNS